MKNISPNAIEKMEKLLATAADKTRLKIMLALFDDSACSCKEESDRKCEVCETLGCMIEKCVKDIAFEIGASQSLVSHQLKVMKDIKLVGSRKEGRRVYYFLKDKHIRLLLSVAYSHVMEENCT
ncbi:MAG: helix-turn-helix transcriptional regulator [Erysipelotrichia bacterium]|nr:helix-turn-helix transcriptional regulator [Erysipelotrichia bacterium]